MSNIYIHLVFILIMLTDAYTGPVKNRSSNRKSIVLNSSITYLFVTPLYFFYLTFTGRLFFSVPLKLVFMPTLI